MQNISIHNRQIGEGFPTYIIAEAGFNHGGNLDMAVTMIAEAANAGADAIKFQSYQARELVSADSPHYQAIIAGELSLDDHIKLRDAAQHAGITMFSTPFSFESVDMLAQINVPAYKIASMDLTHFPLLKYVARQGKPVLLSTGMGTLSEIERAVTTLRDAGNDQIVLLHCVSEYPAPPEHIQLRIIPALKMIFDVPVGYSDHTLGMTVAFASVMLGACLVEKHFTLDKSLPGADHQLSADPPELQKFVHDVRMAETSVGPTSALFDLLTHRSDRPLHKLFRRSIVAKTAIVKGARLTESMLRYVRPGEPLQPDSYEMVVGKVVQRDLSPGEPITLADLMPQEG